MRDLPLPTFPIADLVAPSAPRRSLRRHDSAELDFEVVWARDEEDVRAAQRLRYRVFVDEMGAQLNVPPGAPAHHDVDAFDPFCEHLLVRARAVDGGPGPVIGTYRVLTPASAVRAGGLYSDNEFDLVPLAALRPTMVELRHTHLAPAASQVTPRLPLPIDELRRDLAVEPPALIKGYLRCGAKVLGPPAWDPDFNTADLPLLMRLADLPARYRKHFF